MTATAKQRAALDLYCKVMDEIRVRLSWIEFTLTGDAQLPDVARREFCFLQLRMICELIALACLIAHGDVAAGTALRKQYAADKIVAGLDKLHSQFYPRGLKERTGKEASDMDFEVIEHGYLSKRELLDLYHQCGSILHRGSFKKLLYTATKADVSVRDIKNWRDKIIKLLRSDGRDQP